MINKNRIKIFWVIMIALFLIFLVPYITAVLFAFPSSDDFAMINPDASGNHFMAAVKGANGMWLSWSGGWIYIFLEYLLNPLELFGYRGYYYGMEMNVIFLLFVAAVVIAVCVTLKVLCKIENLKIRVMISFLSIMAILSIHFYEIWFWFVGSSYAWGAFFELLAIASIESLYYKYGRGKLILAGLFGIIACNELGNCIPVGGVYLLFWIWCCKQKREKKHTYGILFLLCVVSGVLNVVAPGNYARQDVIVNGNGAGIIKGIIYAGVDTVTEFINTLTNPVIVFGLLAAFVIGFVYNSNRKLDIKNPAMLFALGIILLFGSMLPVAYGYQSTMIPNRIEFMYVVLFVFYYICISCKLGMYCAVRCNYDIIKTRVFQRGILAGTLLYGFSFIMLSGFILETPWMKQIDRFGAMRKEHNIYVAILDEVLESNEEDVDVDIYKVLHETTGEDVLVVSGVIAPLNLKPDENKGIAFYAKKKSVAVKDIENVIIKWEDLK